MAIAFAAVIQSAQRELPSAYSWIVPFDTLRKVFRASGTPSVALLAYVLGALSTLGFRQSLNLVTPRDSRLRRIVREQLALVANRTPSAAEQRARTLLLLRALAGVLAVAIDVLFLPLHGFLDAIALGIIAAIVARPWPRATVTRFVLYTACVALVFTAVCYWFTVVKALTFLNGRVNQDADIIEFERAITGIVPHRWIAAWASERPTWVHWFDWAYFRMFHHMAVTTAFLIGRRDTQQRTEYLGALAICYMVGAPLYLTFPAAGPVYFEPHHFAFLREQDLIVNTGHSALFFNTGELRAGHAPILMTWSYIACMPSLHMAHETVMLYYVRASKLAFVLAASFLALTAAAVVALGWHYPTDILAGMALAAVSIAFVRWQSRWLLPRALYAAAPESKAISSREPADELAGVVAATSDGDNDGGGAPSAAGRKSAPSRRALVEIHLEELLVVAFFGLLAVLAVARGGDLFEPIQRSRLTIFTLLGLPFVLLVAAARQHLPGLLRALRDFWQVPAALGIYESLKHLHANRITEWLGITPKDALMIRIDEALFGRVLPLYLDPWSTPAFTQVMWVFYVWVYYLAPVVALGLAYSLGRRVLFLRLRKALVLGLLGGYVGYLLVPVAGPLFTIGEQFTRPIVTQPLLKRLVFDTLRYNWDCFPSLHTAIPWVLTFVAWSEIRRGARALCVVAASGVTLSTVALRFHYGIDLIAGVAWAALVAFLVLRVPWVQLPFRFPWRRPEFGRRRRPHRRLALLACVFVGTGSAALLAEQAFEKLLGTLLGASTPAAAVVLAVYFAGLTLGAALYGLVSRRVENPLRVFALLEVGVATWALMLVLAFESLIAWFAPMLAWGAGSDARLILVRTLIACLWILPPTTLMGASFPAMVDALETMRIPGSKRVMGAFYTFNLLGAVAGAVLGPYVFFPSWGVDGTLVFTVLTDISAGAIAFHLSRARRWRKRRGAEGAERSLAGARLPRSAWVLIGVAAASGFVLFSLEVLWTQLIAAVLGNSIYSFAAMLALVLLGLLLGGAVSSLSFARDKSVPAWAIALACIAGGVLLQIQSRYWPRVPGWFSSAGAWVDGFFEAELFRWAVSAFLLLPPALALGFVYPALFRLREFPERNRARFAGWLGAANALGCITGALVTGFFLIPRFGSERSLTAFSIVCALAGAAAAVSFGSRRLRAGVGALAAAVIAFALFAPAWDRLELTSGQHMYFGRNQVWPPSKLSFFHEDAHGGMTTVVHNPAGVRGQQRPYNTLLTNGKFQGNDSWERTAQIGFALIPLTYAHRFDRACVIGLGTGNSAQVPQAAGFREVTIAEIAPGIVEAARYFEHVNGKVLSQRNVRLRLEDGRNLFLLEPELRCDLISMEISSVWFAGSTNLYSFEFYKLARRRLAPRGVFQQWIQIHHIGIEELGSVIATVRAVFPFVSFWVFGGQGILIATEQAQELSVEGIRRFLGESGALGLEPKAAEELMHSALSSRLLAPSEVTNFAQHHPFRINTDRNRYLEYATARYNTSHLDHAGQNVATLARYTRFPLHRLPPGWPEDLRVLVRSAEPRRRFAPLLPPQ